MCPACIAAGVILVANVGGSAVVYVREKMGGGSGSERPERQVSAERNFEETRKEQEHGSKNGEAV